MQYYRFRLRPYRTGSKLPCPRCGRKACFTPYIDTESGILFPDYVGRCDHEQSCGYHFTPSMYFDEHPDRRPSDDATREQSLLPHPCPDTSYIDRNIMEASLQGYDANPLFHYLSSWIGEEAAGNLFRLYNVGTSKQWGGSTVYWQVDSENRIRNGKIMAYDSTTGHRIKGDRVYVTWVHSVLKRPDFHLKQCFFGEHLLPLCTGKLVAVVESEKSALIAAHFMPEMVWLATGGCNGCLNAEVATVLRGRDVMLVPDLGMTYKWRQKIHFIEPYSSSVIVSDCLERLSTPEQQEQGLDVADFLETFAKESDAPKYSNRPQTSREMLDDMIARNPCIQQLIDELDLELIED